MPSDKTLIIPRINAKQSSVMGKIIAYLERYSADIHHMSKEFLYHTFKIRVLSEEVKADDSQGQEYLALEAWKSIFYHWGNIESVCRASNISIDDVITRFKRLENNAVSTDKTKDSMLKGMKISDFVSLIEDLDSNDDKADDEANNTLAEAERHRMNGVSSIFGA